MLTTSCHLLLSGFQEIEYTSPVVKLGIDRQCSDEHRHSVCQSLVSTTIMNSIEQHLLLVVVFRQQEAIDCREECTLKDTMLFAEGVNSIDTHIHRSSQQSLFWRIAIQIRQ